MTQAEVSIEEAIHQLSSKQHMINPEALKAKETLGGFQGDLTVQTKKHLAALSEFDKSIRLLMSLFRESRFEEMVLLLSNPVRLILFNGLVGFVRGMAFALGMGTVLGVAIYSIKVVFGLNLVSFLQVLFLNA